MQILKKMLKGRAVYWQLKANDPFGNPTYYPPVEIKCRWEAKVELIRDYKNREVQSMHRVFVDREVTPGGVLWEGKLQWLTAQNTPFDNVGAQEILSYGEVPTLNYKKALREVRL
jgi:hypothetical protein